MSIEYLRVDSRVLIPVGHFYLEEQDKDVDVIIRGGMTAKSANIMRLRSSTLPGW